MVNTPSESARVSVNLDIANLPPDAPPYILREAAAYGRVIIARAFADFRRNDLGDLPVQLFHAGFQLIHCPSWPNGSGRLKSVVDSVLAQDLRDQEEGDPTLEVFVLGSGDRDFLAVVHALRRHGKRVIVASSPDASNRALVAVADGYLPLPMSERPVRRERVTRQERRPPVDQGWAAAPPAPVQQAAAQPPVLASPAEAQPEPPLSSAVLSEQVLALVAGQPQVTPRQVLQVLAPHNEAGSARRRQAVGDAVAQLLQQGKLVRRSEYVRGRLVEALALSSEKTGAELPAAPTQPAATVAAPAVLSEPEAPSAFAPSLTEVPGEEAPAVLLPEGEEGGAPAEPVAAAKPRRRTRRRSRPSPAASAGSGESSPQ